MQFNQPQSQRLSAEEYETRIWGFVVVMITLILAGIVFSLLYSVTFVTQPIKLMAPIDQAYTKMLNDIVLLIVGGIGGVVGKKGVGAVAQTLASSDSPKPPAVTVPPQTQSALPDFNWMGYKNPELDESWTPGPPPDTPPDHLEDDSVREAISQARKEA